MVRIKKTHLSGDGHNGYPDLHADFDIVGYDDPNNSFEIINIHFHQCGGDWAQCKRVHGCTGPLEVVRSMDGLKLTPMCLGYTAGHAFELGDPPEMIKHLKKLGIEGNSSNERYER